jgi:hypothetical protein
MFGIVWQCLDNEYVRIGNQAKQQLICSFEAKVQVLYSPSVKQPVVLVGSSLLDDVPAEIRLQVSTIPDKRQDLFIILPILDRHQELARLANDSCL